MDVLLAQFFIQSELFQRPRHTINMAEIEEMSDTEGGGAQAVGQAGGGNEGGAQGVQVSEAGAEAQVPPQPPRAAPRLTSVQDEGVKEYITVIRSEVAITNKNIRTIG